jgi:hypothetical protein
MSAITHSSAFLSAKARVAPGAAKVRAAAAARPAARRAFVVRAADKKKGTPRHDICLDVNPYRSRAREAALAAFARSRTRLSPRRGRSSRAPPPSASARARRRPGPASGRFHRVVLFADGITFSNHAQVPSP